MSGLFKNLDNDSELNEKTQIKRKYAEHSAIHVMEKAPVRNKVIEFVGKRYVTEEELKNFVNGLNEKDSEGNQVNSKWLGRNKRYFEAKENRGQRVITLSKYGQRVLEKIVKAESQAQSSSVNEGRAQIKRKYGEYSNIRVNEKAPVRNKVIQFVGKRFVTEEEMQNFLTAMTEERGKDFNNKQWFSRNEKYFESFENRGQKVWTLSKYGKRVLEMIKNSQKNLNESIGLFKSEIFESVRIENYLNEGALAKKGAKELQDLNLEVQMEEADEEMSDFYEVVCDKLGAKPNEIIQIDSETYDEDPLMMKIYTYIESHFNGRENVSNKAFGGGMGQQVLFDAKLNVIRLDDYGFVAFYFSPKSNF